MSDITTLRTALFETLEKLKAKEIDLDQARAINDVAKTIVDTAKVEVSYLTATGGGESRFLDTTIGQENLPKGILAVHRHRLAG